ncbi:MAG: hypothetical protein ACK46P_08330 [Flavobacteriia bacterium]
MKLLSVLLLVAFTAVLMPKQWWHHCSHTEHQKSALSSGQTLDEDCPVCDLSLSVFTSPTALVFSSVKQVPDVRVELNYSGLSQTTSILFQLRAPPASPMF